MSKGAPHAQAEGKFGIVHPYRTHGISKLAFVREGASFLSSGFQRELQFGRGVFQNDIESGFAARFVLLVDVASQLPHLHIQFSGIELELLALH